MLLILVVAWMASQPSGKKKKPVFNLKQFVKPVSNLHKSVT